MTNMSHLRTRETTLARAQQCVQEDLSLEMLSLAVCCSEGTEAGGGGATLKNSQTFN